MLASSPQSASGAVAGTFAHCPPRYTRMTLRLFCHLRFKVSNAKRNFERAEASSLTLETSRNRRDTRAMLSSRHLNSVARSDLLLRAGAPVASASPGAMLAQLQQLLQKGDPASKGSALEEREGGDSDGSEENGDGRDRINGDESFAQLWAKLVKYGWTYQKGKGLATWIYQRPGAVEASKEEELASAYPHTFTSPAALLQFVRAVKLDGVTSLGHVDEVYVHIVKAGEGDRRGSKAVKSRVEAAAAMAAEAAAAAASETRQAAVVDADAAAAAVSFSEEEDVNERSEEVGSERLRGSRCLLGDDGNYDVPIDVTTGWGSGALFGFGVPNFKVRFLHAKILVDGAEEGARARK